MREYTITALSTKTPEVTKPAPLASAWLAQSAKHPTHFGTTHGKASPSHKTGAEGLADVEN